MAAIASAATGVWSAGATWAGGVVPTVADTVTIAAGHTVTLDIDATVAGVTFASPTAKIAVTTARTLVVNGNVSAAASTTTTIGFDVTAAFNLTVTGTIRSLNTNCRIIYVNTTAPVSVSAASIQGPAAGTVGAIIHVAGAVAVVSYTGKCFTAVGSTAATIIVAGAGASVTVHGDLDNELTLAGGYNVRMQAASTFVVDGDILGRSGARAQVSVEVAGCTVTARDAVASTATYAVGVSAAGLAPTVNLRSCTAPGAFPAVYAPAGRLNNSGDIMLSASGQLPFNTASLFVSADSKITLPTTAQGEWTTLSSQVVEGGPDPSDVRSGLIYGSETGACVLPSPTDVSIGAVVDGSSGLAALLPQQLAAVTGAQIQQALGG